MGNALKDPDILSGIVFFILFGLLGWALLFLTVNHRRTIHFQIKLFVYAFVVRFAFSIAIYQLGLVNVLGDEDGIGWYFGVVNYQKWQRIGLFDMPAILMGAFEGNHRGYYYLLGFFFYLTDSPARFVAAALNCFCGALTVVFVYRIARSLFSEWVAVRAAWWTCLFPSMIIWSAQTVKEPVVILIETVAIYGCVQLKLSGFSLRHLLLCALAVVMVAPFRFYAAYIAGVAILLALILPDFTKRKFSTGAAIGVGFLVVPLMLMSGVLSQHEVQFEQFDAKYVQKFKQDVGAGAGSGVESKYDLQTSEGLGLATAVGAAHLLLAPFPWQLGGGSVRMLLSIPELVVWWWLFFVGLVPGTLHAIRTRFNEIQPLLFFILGLGFLYSMMFGNVGLVFRQRAQLLPWLLILAVVGLEQRAIKRLTIQNRMAEKRKLARFRNERAGGPPAPANAPVGVKSGT